MVKTLSVLERSISQSLDNEHEESLTLVAVPELEGSHPDCAAALSRVGASRSLTWRPMRDRFGAKSIFWGIVLMMRLNSQENPFAA